MVSAQNVYDAVIAVKDQETFIQNLLIDTLSWDIDPQTQDIEDTAYEWTSTELNMPLLDEKTNGRALNISFQNNNGWGVFLLEFADEEPFLRSRGFTTILRQLLKALVPSRRKDSSIPSWKQDNLLFICTFGYKHYRFAYFKAPKGKEKTSPISLFGWNKDDTSIRTLCEHNLRYLEWDGQKQWHQAFSIEKVTKEFYKAYAEVFEKIEDAIRAANKGLEKEQIRLFTQMLFNRLMFLRFVEKKGWLKFGATPDYLREIYAAGGINGSSFYLSRLCPLFFEGLAVEGNNDKKILGEVPFLNGGLFEKTDIDTLVTDIPDDKVFGELLSDTGLFYRFNFTVEESTPLDIEVAVDPEMLGKVFEELVTGRHESGSYYTPRPIVSFMCKEALKGYLSEKTSASAESIEALVDDYEILKLNEGQAHEILFYLDTIRACDPACGSGAYLLGLLQELIAIRRTLQNVKLKTDPSFLYNLKLGIISRSLYGVDIDEFATNIAKLRLWLSLAVESDIPHSLPNLDFKIETGDSVLGPCRQAMGPMFESQLNSLAEEIADLKIKHELAHSEEKYKLARLINEKIKYLKGFAPITTKEKIINWPADFAEVFSPMLRSKRLVKGNLDLLGDIKGKKTCEIKEISPGGFDIVLANPPYIRQELIKDIKSQLKDIFPKTFVGTADLYTYFYTRAVEMLAPDGMISFISSNKWFRANYGTKLRRFITDNCRIYSITDFGELPVFETAATFPMIFVAQKSQKKNRTVFTQFKTLGPPYPDVKAVIQSNGSILPDDAIQGDNWNLADSETLKILGKMKKAGIPLKEYVNGEIYRGILTGFNEAFVIDYKTRQKLIDEDPMSDDLIKPMCKGDDVRKWHIRDMQRWLIVTHVGVEIHKYPAIFNHLKKWQKQLKLRQDHGDHWWELRSCTYYDLFEKPKIHYPEIAKESRFAFDKFGFYPLKTVFTIPSSDLYLLGILNSSQAWDYLKKICSVLGDEEKHGRLTLQTVFVEQLPIPQATEKEKMAIEKLVQKCLDAKGVGCEQWEKEIDERVAKLYGLQD